MQKVIDFPLTRIILAVLFVGIGVVLLQVVINLLVNLVPTDNPLGSIVLTILAILGVCLAYAGYVRLIEKRPMKELEGAGAWHELGFGILVGMGSFSLIILILWILGVYQINGVNSWLVIFPALVANVPSGFIQEIIFRGVIFRITEDWLGPWWALGISSVLFGIIHVLSASATVQSVVAITLEAGVLLGAAYLLTHRLWLPIGIHVAWDLANDGIFGVGAAGISGASIQGILQATLTGPVLLSGGTAGVEASLISVIVLLVVSIDLLRRAFRKQVK
jgi:CAAX protease family protein